MKNPSNRGHKASLFNELHHTETVSPYDWFKIICFSDQTNYKQACGRYATRRAMSHVGSLPSICYYLI